MKLKTINARHYQLLRTGQPVIDLKINGSFKTRGEARIDDNVYTFTPENFWQTKWLVRRNDLLVARLTLFSKIELFDEGGGKVMRTYSLKRKGVFSPNYELLKLPGKRRVFDAEKITKWYSAKPAFDVKLFSTVSNPDELVELIIYSAFMRGLQQRQGAA